MVNPVSHATSASLNNPVMTGAKYCLMVVLGVAVITASAKTTVPFWPVPMTLQTMAGMVPVYLLGLAGLSGFVASEKVVALGFTPFILGDTIKIALVALGSAAITRLTKHKPSNRADAA
jgi:biotin transporter BioY